MREVRRFEGAKERRVVVLCEALPTIMRAMLEAGSCTFYTPGSLGDVNLELFAVLRS